MGDRAQNWGGANTHWHRAVGDTTAATLGKKVPFLAALRWHPRDQLHHGTPGDPTFAVGPRGPQLCHGTQRTPDFLRAELGQGFPIRVLGFYLQDSSAGPALPIGCRAIPKKDSAIRGTPCAPGRSSAARTLVCYELC